MNHLEEIRRASNEMHKRRNDVKFSDEIRDMLSHLGEEEYEKEREEFINKVVEKLSKKKGNIKKQFLGFINENKDIETPTLDAYIKVFHETYGYPVVSVLNYYDPKKKNWRDVFLHLTSDLPLRLPSDYNEENHIHIIQITKKIMININNHMYSKKSSIFLERLNLFNNFIELTMGKYEDKS